MASADWSLPQKTRLAAAGTTALPRPWYPCPTTQIIFPLVLCWAGWTRVLHDEWKYVYSIGLEFCTVFVLLWKLCFELCCSQGQASCRTECWSVNSVYKIKNNAIYETSYMFQYSSKSQFKTEWSESHIFTCIKVSLIYEQMFNIKYIYIHNI